MHLGLAGCGVSVVLVTLLPWWRVGPAELGAATPLPPLSMGINGGCTPFRVEAHKGCSGIAQLMRVGSACLAHHPTSGSYRLNKGLGAGLATIALIHVGCGAALWVHSAIRLTQDLPLAGMA